MGMPQNEDDQTLAQRFATGLGSLLGSSAAGAPAAQAVPEAESSAPLLTPPPAAPSAPQPSPRPMQLAPKQQPQDDEPLLSDNVKMALIPLATTLLGGLAGGNTGAQLGAGSGLTSVGKELDKRDQRALLQQQKDLQEKRDVDKALQIEKGKEDYREQLAEKKSDLKPVPKKYGTYVDSTGKHMRYGLLDEDGNPVDPDSGADRGPVKREAADVLADKDAADEKKSDKKISHQFANDMNPRKGRAGQFGALAKRNDAADYVLGVLTDPDTGAPRALSKGERTEAANAVAALVSNGGVAAQHTIEAMTPSSVKGDINDKISYLFNEAEPTEMPSIIQRLIDTAKREKGIIGNQMRESQIQTISDASVHDWRQRHPEDWARTLKAAGLNPDDFDENSLPIENPSWKSAKAPDTSKLTRQQKIDQIKALRGK